MTGEILRAINNIYTVRFADGVRLCRIKGKVLEGCNNEYSPIAVGDRVECTSDNMVTARLPRSSRFARWNLKRSCDQVIAANMDMVAIVVSRKLPPFRPYFLDRAIACVFGCPTVILASKADLGECEMLSLYRELGYTVLEYSAVTGEGTEAIRDLFTGKCVALVGQSGVGKSTLINLLTFSSQSTGEVSGKYKRGKHTTNHSLLIEGENFRVIDTPGVREIFPPRMEIPQIQAVFPDITGMKCLYPGCTHTGEQGCGVEKALESGALDSRRYESYLRMVEANRSLGPEWSTRR